MRSTSGSAQTARKAWAPARSAASGSVAAAERALGDALRRLGLDLLEDRLEELLLVAELVIEGAARHAGRADDLLGADRAVAALREQGASGAQQPVARRARALFLLVGGLDFHTDCM